MVGYIVMLFDRRSNVCVAAGDAAAVDANECVGWYTSKAHNTTS